LHEVAVQPRARYTLGTCLKGEFKAVRLVMLRYAEENSSRTVLDSPTFETVGKNAGLKVNTVHFPKTSNKQ
jgi:hypothetical protein